MADSIALLLAMVGLLSSIAAQPRAGSHSGDTVHALRALDLSGGDFEPEPLLESAGHGAPDRVRLPASGFGNLSDRCSFRAHQQLDQQRLLGACPRGPLAVGARRGSLFAAALA